MIRLGGQILAAADRHPARLRDLGLMHIPEDRHRSGLVTAFSAAENAILGGIQFLLTLPLGLGSLIMGALYAPTVVTGIHQMYTTIDLGQIATYGVTYWLPLASAAGDLQYSIQFQERVRKLFTGWLSAHIAFSIVFYLLLALHIWAGIYFGLRWFR